MNENINYKKPTLWYSLSIGFFILSIGFVILLLSFLSTYLEIADGNGIFSEIEKTLLLMTTLLAILIPVCLTNALVCYDKIKKKLKEMEK